MANYRITVITSCLLGLALVAACDKKSDESAAPATTATTSAAPAVSTPAAVSATASAPVAAASASASSSADAAAGDVKLHLDKVKVSSGKIDGVDRKFKSRSAAIRKKCLDPALKKEPAIDGELKLVIELDGDGKVTKQTPTVTGKVPDDLVSCIKKFIEKELDFDTDNSKAKAEVNYKFGPHADDAPAPADKKLSLFRNE